MSKQTIVIKVKLGRPKGMRRGTFIKLLAECGEACDRARNKMIRAWELDRLQVPWEPDLVLKKDGTAATWSNGRPRFKNQPFRDGHGETWLYHQGRDAARWLSSTVISSLVQEIKGDLKTQTPYDAKPGFVWESILSYDRQPPTYRRRQIPTPNNCITLSWDDQCWLSLPLLSKEDTSGRPRRPSISLMTNKLTSGQKEWLRQIVEKKVKLSDSLLVPKDNGNWYWHCVILRDPPEIAFSADRALTLWCAVDEKDPRPFIAELPDGRRINIGEGLPVVFESERVSRRRRAIRHASRNGIGGGRGKQRFYRTLRPCSRRMDRMKDEFCKDLADRLARLCEEHDCGELLYREPSRFMRRMSWFERREVPFNWTGLMTRLQSRCLRSGIKLAVAGWKKAEYDETRLAQELQAQ